MKRIALISCFYAPRIGGIEKYTERLAENIPQAQVFTSEKKAPSNTTFIPFFKIGKFKIPKIRQTYQTLKKFAPDIIHINGPLPHATITGIIARYLRIPTILTYHGDPTPSNPLIKIAAKIDQQLYRFIFNQIIVTSPKYKTRVSKFFPKNKISITYLGIDKEFFKKRQKSGPHHNSNPSHNGATHTKHKVLFVAKLDENHYYKGIKTFLAAAKISPEIEFIVIGDGPNRSTLESQAPSNVVFLGAVDTPTLADHFSAADIFVLPSESQSEGFGIVLLESAACGTPVITTNVVGSSQFITKHNFGILIPPKSPTKLSQEIKKLLKNPLKYKKLQENCKKISSQLTWEKTAQETQKIYEKL